MPGQNLRCPPTPTLLPFALPSICQMKVTAAFGGGRISSDFRRRRSAVGRCRQANWVDRYAGRADPRPSRPGPDHPHDVRYSPCGLKNDKRFIFSAASQGSAGRRLSAKPSPEREKEAPKAVLCAMEDGECPLPDAVAAAWADDPEPRQRRFAQRHARAAPAIQRRRFPDGIFSTTGRAVSARGTALGGRTGTIIEARMLNGVTSWL
jgi:hypothetical protein